MGGDAHGPAGRADRGNDGDADADGEGNEDEFRTSNTSGLR